MLNKTDKTLARFQESIFQVVLDTMTHKKPRKKDTFYSYFQLNKTTLICNFTKIVLDLLDSEPTIFETYIKKIFNIQRDLKTHELIGMGITTCLNISQQQFPNYPIKQKEQDNAK